MSPQAVFFDLDDTIIAFEVVAELAWIKVCQAFLGKTGLCSQAELLNSIHSVRDWYWSDPERHRVGRLNMLSTRRMIVKMALEKLGCDNESYAIEIADHFSKLRTELIYVLPGAKETLEKFCRHGILLALITNGTVREQRAKLDRFDLAKYFQVILIEEQLGFGKPDARIFQLCLSKFQLAANQVWMVGDNLEWDVAAPQRVGIYSVWNDYKGKGLPPDSHVKPDRIVNSISEIVV